MTENEIIEIMCFKKLLDKYARACQWYISASDTQLNEAEETRDDALERVNAIELEIFKIEPDYFTQRYSSHIGT